MNDDRKPDNVLPFVRRNAAGGHLGAVAAGRIRELDDQAAFFRLAWRTRNLRLVRTWQASGGPFVVPKAN